MNYSEKRKELESSKVDLSLCDDCYDSYIMTMPHMKYFWDWEAWDRDHIAGVRNNKTTLKTLGEIA